MTFQMHDLAVVLSAGRWSFSSIPCLGTGNSSIHVIRSSSDVTFQLADNLDGFTRFAHWTTAGMDWMRQMLGYLLELSGKHFLVIRPWWGDRMIVSLDDMQCVNFAPMESELIQFERQLILEELHSIASELESGRTLDEDREANNVMCTLDGCLYWPGLLDLVESIPILRFLEDRLGASEDQWQTVKIANLNLRPCPEKRFVQNSLRRLGVPPREPTYLAFDEDMHEVSTIPADRTRQAEQAETLRSPVSLSDVFRLLGTPDYIERGGTDCDAEGEFYQTLLRYEIYSDTPYTLLLYLNRNKDWAIRCVKYDPPFWHGPDIFPSDHSLIGHNGETVIGFIEDLDNGTFVGDIVEL